MLWLFTLLGHDTDAALRRRWERKTPKAAAVFGDLLSREPSADGPAQAEEPLISAADPVGKITQHWGYLWDEVTETDTYAIE